MGERTFLSACLLTFLALLTGSWLGVSVIFAPLAFVPIATVMLILIWQVKP
jgi:hypothetical protein